MLENLWDGGPQCSAKGRWDRLRKEPGVEETDSWNESVQEKRDMEGRVQAGGKQIGLNSEGLERRATS